MYIHKLKLRLSFFPEKVVDSSDELKPEDFCGAQAGFIFHFYQHSYDDKPYAQNKMILINLAIFSKLFRF